MRILALIPGGIGDQILFFPTLLDLKEKYPKATLDVVVEPRSRGAYRIFPQVHRVLTFNFPDRNPLTDYLNLLGQIREVEYDITISSAKSWAVGLILWLNIPVRVGYKRENSWYFSKPVPLNTEQYLANTYHDLLIGLDIDKPCPEVKISVPTEDIDWAEAEQARLGIKESGYIIFHNSPENETDRIYPVSKWERIVRDINNKQPGLPIVLLDCQGNFEWADMMKRDIPSLKITSPVDVGKEAAILAGANLTICNHSAVTHLSITVNTYTVVLLDSTENPKRLLPPDSDRAVAVQSTTSRSIVDIEPASVLEKIWHS